MMGISWGGFNGLQVAARRPPALKAIITLCSTDDRYADDIHYKGGCVINENLGWGGTMLAYSSRPPDPVMVGERWRDMWLERLEPNPSWPSDWLQPSAPRCLLEARLAWPRISPPSRRRSWPSAAGTMPIPMPCRGC